MSPLRSARMPWWLSLPLTVAIVVALVLVAGQLRWIKGLSDPFGTETRDRTGPTLLKSIQDMSRYEAASGSFQVVVDLDKDAKFLPDAVRGTRTLFVGTGSVAAYVDLGGVGKDAVTVSKDRRTAKIRVPHARLGKPALDVDHSYAVTKERGLLDRLGDLFSDNPNDEREVHQLAARHIATAAKRSDLQGRAEKNTRSMLTSLLTSLGYRHVTVEFGGPRPGGSGS